MAAVSSTTFEELRRPDTTSEEPEPTDEAIDRLPTNPSHARHLTVIVHRSPVLARSASLQGPSLCAADRSNPASSCQSPTDRRIWRASLASSLTRSFFVVQGGGSSAVRLPSASS